MIIMEANNQPLVSVPVITYNSAKYVIETLESIKAQTYQNIELIISDDCSTDNTVELCQKWVDLNKDRFARVELIIVEVNAGVAANLNRAESACQGEWVKVIAGDDLLLPDCVESCVTYVLENNANCIFGKIEAFGDDMQLANRLTREASLRNEMMSKLSSKELYDVIVRGNPPSAPAFFYNRQFVVDNNIQNDCRIPMIEDLPKWLNILKIGGDLKFLDKVIVRYRIGGISTSCTWQTPLMYENQRKMFFYYQFDYLYKLEKDKIIEKILQHEIDIYTRLYNDAHNARNSQAYKIGSLLLFPLKKMRNVCQYVRKIIDTSC